MSNERTSRSIYIERERKLEEFVRFIESSATCVLSINTKGDGGIGKTQLLLRFQKYCQERQDRFVSSDKLIDFYDTASHTKLGIIRQIAEHVGLSNLPEFKKILAEYDQTTDASILSKLENTFAEDYKAFAQSQKENNKCIVLFFDTYEVIQNIDQEKKSVYSTEFSRWIETELFPILVENAKVVISGRYSLTDIDLNKFSVQPLELSHFSISETENFLKTCFNGDENILSQKIGSKEFINTLHILADGRPILLALLIDAINYEKKPLDVKRLLQEIEQDEGKVAQTILEKQQVFEKALISRIVELPTPEDRVVVFMAIAYRRMTPDLLSFLLRRPIETVRKILETLKPFSFIKIKETGEIYLLHDEMRRMIIYLWLKKHDEHRTMRKGIAGKIVAYYDQAYLSLKNLSETDREIYSVEAIEYEFIANADNNFGKVLERFSNEFDTALQDGRYDRCDMLLRIAKEYYEDIPFPQNYHIDWRELDYYRQTYKQKNEDIFSKAQNILEQHKDNQIWQDSELPAHLLYVSGATAGDFNEGIRLLRQASEIFCKRGIDYWMYRTDNLLGYTCYRQGRFGEAEELLEQARKGFYALLIYERLSEKQFSEEGKMRRLLHGFLLAMGNLAMVYSYRGHFERAIRKAEMTLTIKKYLPRNQLEIARSNVTIGDVSLFAGDKVNAWRHLMEAKNILSHKINDRLIEGRMKPAIAFLQYRVDRFSHLLQSYRAEEIKWILENRVSEKDMGRLEDARKLVESAIKVLETPFPIKKELSDAYYILGELYMVTPGKEHWQQAKTAFEKALKFGGESQFLYREAATLVSLTALYYLQNEEPDMSTEKKKDYQIRLQQIDLAKYPELAGKLSIILGDEQFDNALTLLRSKNDTQFIAAKESLRNAFTQYIQAARFMKDFNEDRYHLALRIFYYRLKKLADEEQEGKIVQITDCFEEFRLLWREKANEFDEIYVAFTVRLLSKSEQKEKLSELKRLIQNEVTKWNIGLAVIFNACLIEVYRSLSPLGNENDEYLEQFLLQLIFQANYYRILHDEYDSRRTIEIVKKESKNLKNQHIQKAIEGYADCQRGTFAYRRGEYGSLVEIFLQDDLHIGRERFDEVFPEARKEAFYFFQDGEEKLCGSIEFWRKEIRILQDDHQKQEKENLLKYYFKCLGETRFRLGELLMLNEQFDDYVSEEGITRPGALSLLKMAIENTMYSEDWYRYDDAIQSYVNALYFSRRYNDSEYRQDYIAYIAELEKDKRHPSVMGKLRIMQGDVLFSEYFQREDEPESGYHYIIRSQQKEKSKEQRKEIVRRMWSYYVEACNFMAQQKAGMFASAVAILQRRIQLIRDAEALEMIRQGLQSLWERQTHLKDRQEELYTLVQFAEIRRLILTNEKK